MISLLGVINFRIKWETFSIYGNVDHLNAVEILLGDRGIDNVPEEILGFLEKELYNFVLGRFPPIDKAPPTPLGKGQKEKNLGSFSS